MNFTFKINYSMTHKLTSKETAIGKKSNFDLLKDQRKENIPDRIVASDDQ